MSDPKKPEALSLQQSTPEAMALHRAQLEIAAAVTGVVPKGLTPKRPEYWYRLTTTTGPAAIERIEVDAGKVVDRRIVEEKNVRAVVLARLGDMLDGVEES